MKLLKTKKMIAATMGLVGLSAMLLTPVSQAHGRYDRHQWHQVNHWSREHRCHRITYRRYCRVRHGMRQCYVTRHSHFNCVY